MKTDEMLIIHKIVTIINSNMYQDKYDEWVNHPNPMVRYALVCNDFKPELFIYNNNTMVRSEALKRRPDLQYQALKDMLDNPNNLENLDNILTKQTYIDINILKTFISNCKTFKPNFQYKPYEIKLKAIENELLPSEQKLSPYQLFKLNNPSWARDFNSEAIQSILEISEFQDDIDDKEFERYFTPEIQPKGGKIIVKK